MLPSFRGLSWLHPITPNRVKGRMWYIILITFIMLGLLIGALVAFNSAREKNSNTPSCLLNGDTYFVSNAGVNFLFGGSIAAIVLMICRTITDILFHRFFYLPRTYMGTISSKLFRFKPSNIFWFIMLALATLEAGLLIGVLSAGWTLYSESNNRAPALTVGCSERLEAMEQNLLDGSIIMSVLIGLGAIIYSADVVYMSIKLPSDYDQNVNYMENENLIPATNQQPQQQQQQDPSNQLRLNINNQQQQQYVPQAVRAQQQQQTSTNQLRLDNQQQQQQQQQQYVPQAQQQNYTSQTQNRGRANPEAMAKAVDYFN